MTGGQARGAQQTAAREARRATLRQLVASGSLTIDELRAALGSPGRPLSVPQLRADLRAIGEPPRKAGRKPYVSAATKKS